MIRFIVRHVITGLMTILPVILTVYLFYWFATTAETLLGGLIRPLLPEAYALPGIGLAAGLLGAFLVGLMMHAYIVQRFFALGERLIYRTPVIKSVYRALRDFLDYFSPNKQKEFDQVVSVSVADGMQVIGFVTQGDHRKLPAGFGEEGCVLVYIPMSYMIGGYTVMVPRERVKPVAMSMDEAMRFALTAGVASTGEGGEAGRGEGKG